MSERYILDFSYLGSVFAGVLVIIAVALALSRKTLWRVAFWLAVIADVCLLVGAAIFNGLIWHIIGQDTSSQWWLVTSRVLLATGSVVGVVAMVLLMRELALRGASRWMMLCAVGLLVLVGANSSMSSYTLVQVFDASYAFELLNRPSEQHVYFGVVSLLLVCSLLPALVVGATTHRAGQTSMVAD